MHNSLTSQYSRRSSIRLYIVSCLFPTSTCHGVAFNWCACVTYDQNDSSVVSLKCKCDLGGGSDDSLNSTDDDAGGALAPPTTQGCVTAVVPSPVGGTGALAPPTTQCCVTTAVPSPVGGAGAEASSTAIGASWNAALSTRGGVATNDSVQSGVDVFCTSVAIYVFCYNATEREI